MNFHNILGDQKQASQVSGFWGQSLGTEHLGLVGKITQLPSLVLVQVPIWEIAIRKFFFSFL